MAKNFSYHHSKYQQQLSLFSDMVTKSDEHSDNGVDYQEIPEILPVSKVYMLVKWINILQGVSNE